MRPTRHRRFQLSMQAWFCVSWIFHHDLTSTSLATADEVAREYEELAGWRGRFKV